MIKLRYKGIFGGIAAIIVLSGFLSEPRALLIGASRGLLLCSEVIIPSLFPFAVITLFLFSCGFTNYVKKAIERPAKAFFGLSGEALLIMLFSFIGGFPVGAKLIDKCYTEGKISEKTAKRMLCYSVNPGPAFVIIGIGQTMMGNTKIGVILFASGILASLTIALVFSVYEKKESFKEAKSTRQSIRLSDTFVNSVFDASYSIIAICGFVILFSAIIGVISHFSESEITKALLATLEISNGVSLFPRNIAFLAFLISFSGFCIHFQILSVTKNISVSYKNLFVSRLICGVLSLIYSRILLNIFKVEEPTLALNSELFGSLTVVSFPLSAALIFMAITLLASVRQNFVEKRR